MMENQLKLERIIKTPFLIWNSEFFGDVKEWNSEYLEVYGENKRYPIQC